MSVVPPERQVSLALSVVTGMPLVFLDHDNAWYGAT